MYRMRSQAFLDGISGNVFSTWSNSCGVSWYSSATRAFKAGERFAVVAPRQDSGQRGDLSECGRRGLGSRDRQPLARRLW
jgi:hypothetical protein